MAGSWVAVLGLVDLGLKAVEEVGVDLERVAVIAEPQRSSWAAVAATLVDAFDMVVVSPGCSVRPVEARRLAARARERGAVLVQVSGAGRGRAGQCPVAADVRLSVTDTMWEGLARGHGHLEARRITIQATGRRRASRPRWADLWLLGTDGRVLAVETDRSNVSDVGQPEVVPLRQVG